MKVLSMKKALKGWESHGAKTVGGLSGMPAVNRKMSVINLSVKMGIMLFLHSKPREYSRADG